MQGVARGLELAARDRGLTYEIDQANNDPVVMTEQVRKFVGLERRRAGDFPRKLAEPQHP